MKGAKIGQNFVFSWQQKVQAWKKNTTAGHGSRYKYELSETIKKGFEKSDEWGDD